jgi:predicted outer membrane repeat protein
MIYGSGSLGQLPASGRIAQQIAATGQGGATYNEGSLTLAYCSVTQNYAATGGGAIYTSAGYTTTLNHMNPFADTTLLGKSEEYGPGTVIVM